MIWMNGSDTSDMQPKRIDNFRFIGYTISEISSDQRPDRRICPWLRAAALSFVRDFAIMKQILLMFVKNFFLEVTLKKGRTK